MPPNHIREALGDSGHYSFVGAFRWSFGLNPLGVHDAYLVLIKIAIKKQAIFKRTEFNNMYCE